MRNLITTVAIGLSLLLQVGLAGAATIVDTGATPYATTWNWGVWHDQWLAGGFSISDPYSVTSIEGYLWGADPSANTLTVALFSDSNNLPATELYSKQFAVTGSDAAWYGASGLNWQLSPGNYWAVFAVKPADTYSGSLPDFAATPLANEAFLYDFGTGPQWYNTTLNSAFRILGDENPVPEPSSLLLFGAGIAALACWKSRKPARS